MASDDEFFEDAEYVFDLATKNDWAAEDDELIKDRVLKELVFVNQHIKRSTVVHRILRSRTEYLLLLVHSIIRSGRATCLLDTTAVASLHNLLQDVLTVSRNVVEDDDESEVDRDDSNHCLRERERALPASRTQWTEMCATALACAIVKLLAQVPVPFPYLQS